MLLKPWVHDVFENADFTVVEHWDLILLGQKAAQSGLHLIGGTGTLWLKGRWCIQSDITNAILCVDKCYTDLSYVYSSRTYKAQKINISSWRNQAKMYAKQGYKEDGIFNF